MINIVNKVDCCGCQVCGDSCPTNAISFKKDIEGFWYPEVNQSLCINCNACEKVCPIGKAEDLKKDNFKESICYAVEHKNLEVVFDSTSGGAFSALADLIFKSHGYVGGAIFNDDLSVSHFITDDKSDLPKLRSSKYLQSDCLGYYKKVKQVVKTGRLVLVCGCPCQMSGLRLYLGKEYDNLIISDFICRGINSPKVWRKYLDTFEERYHSPVVYAKAKSKEYGWRNLTQKVTLENGKSYYETKEESLFTRGYVVTGAYCRPSCYSCNFKGFPRIADITLADYWGIENATEFGDKDLGTSLVMLNTEKGRKFFENAKIRTINKKMQFSTIFDGNPSLIKSIESPKINRSEFFKEIDDHSFSYVAKKYSFAYQKSRKKKILILLSSLLRFIRSNGILFHDLLRFLTVNIKVNCTLKEIFKGNYVIPTHHSILRIHKKANVTIHGLLIYGEKKDKKSKLESRLLLEKNSSFSTQGDVIIGFGSDIQVFTGGSLIIGSGFATNINTTIICENKIIIGKNVKVGRNVTIRDNNGKHYLNRAGYKNSRPTIIGDKVWLAEGCTIMPGVKIGDGAIIGGGAFVNANVPPYSLVVGNPAQIIDENVLWKY